MRLLWKILLLLGACLNMSCRYQSNALDIPLEVEQLPTITEHSPASLIAFPFEESFPVKCEATGNPGTEFRWTKNGQDFDPYQDPRLKTLDDSGTFIIPNNGNLTEFQGNYRCFATNKLGTAMSEEIEFIVPNIPKFPKEIIDPIEVMEGQSVILECNPPKGIPPLQIYWMTISLQHIEQDERVSLGLNGNLYFSNAIETDSRRDYCCFAAFPRIRTIVQKTAMSVVVKSTNSLLERKPSLLTPTGKESHTYLVKGEDLHLECIAEGFPTPKVEWVKIGFHKLPERVVVESHGKLLTIEMVNEEDEGKYMCRSKNPHGEVVHYFHVTVEEPPEFEIEPQSQLVTIGADVVIKCVVKANPQPIVVWRVNGRLLNEVPTSNRKVLKDGTISIHNAKPENSAVYQCEATNRHGTILANANIMIMNIQPLILTENNLQYMAVEGKGVAMHCKVFSSPTSSITWSKTDSANSVEGERFSVHKNGSLEIHNVMKEDMGEYSCFAQNTEGKVAIAATLEVKDPTRIVDPPHDLRVLVRTTIQFSCQAEFDPSIGDDFEILWEKDGMALNASENARYILDDGVLEIINVSFGDQGFYACVARTPVDQDMAVAQLSVVDVPDPPEDMILSEHNGRSVKLQWIPGDDHNSSITGNSLNTLIVHILGDVAVGVMNNTMVKVRWDHVHKDKLNGHLGGYRISFWRLRSLLYSKKTHGDKHTLTFSGERNDVVVTGLKPFSEYSLIVMAFNSRGNGPGSHPVSFKTPEGVPGQVSAFSVTNIQKHKVTLTWSPPVDTNGLIIGYILQYQLINDTEELGSLTTLNISADGSKLHLQDLEALSKYKFYLRCCTRVGCGPAASEERTTVPEATSTDVASFNIRKSGSQFPPRKTTVSPVANATLSSIAVLNISTSVSHNFANISWIPGTEQTESELYVAFMNNREGNWKISDALNSSKTFHIIEGLEPGTEYTVRLMTKSWVDNSSIFEDVIRTSAKGLASIHGGISNQGWFIGLMCAIALLTLIVLISCFVNRNKGGKYSAKLSYVSIVLHSDNDEKPLKSSQHSLNGDLKGGDSGDSMVDYGDEDAHFNEDGSFIGEYSGRKERVSMEIKGNNQSTA
uniref:Cell adhesion molecule L1-like b n=1 Tax=Sinocyclocheilus grahami TaxID=75366 RepID=A0A672NTP8_SINGR